MMALRYADFGYILENRPGDDGGRCRGIARQ